MINNGNKWEIATQYIDGDDTIGTVHRFDYIEDREKLIELRNKMNI